MCSKKKVLKSNKKKIIIIKKGTIKRAYIIFMPLKLNHLPKVISHKILTQQTISQPTKVQFIVKDVLLVFSFLRFPPFFSPFTLYTLCIFYYNIMPQKIFQIFAKMTKPNLLKRGRHVYKYLFPSLDLHYFDIYLRVFFFAF